MSTVSWKTKVNSFAAMLLAMLFCHLFGLLKHDSLMSPLIPFANDPYDSIGSFAAIVVLPLSALALYRTFRKHGAGDGAAEGAVAVARTQMAVVLAVLITAGSDGIAMARHPAQWMRHSGSRELCLVLAGLAASAVVLAIAIRGTRTRQPTLSINTGAHWRILLVTAIGAGVLAAFPEAVIKIVPGELAALATGVVILFGLMATYLRLLIPGEASRPQVHRGVSSGARRWLPSIAAIAIGLAMGACLLWLEAHEDGGIASDKFLLVASVFLGAGAFGFFTALTFLRKPLGLFTSH